MLNVLLTKPPLGNSGKKSYMNRNGQGLKGLNLLTSAFRSLQQWQAGWAALATGLTGWAVVATGRAAVGAAGWAAGVAVCETSSSSPARSSAVMSR